MIPRDLSSALRKVAKGYPVVSITGPRQAGKTTLSRLGFPYKTSVSLEDPDHLRFALPDPRGFLQGFPHGAILDEIQRAPELFSYMQGVVDARQEPGFFILTGSQHFGLLAQISQTLAGRVALLELLPLDRRPQPSDVPQDLIDIIKANWNWLCEQWDAKYPDNPVQGHED
jgi:predicted AAA+ superfamily ATPase